MILFSLFQIPLELLFYFRIIIMAIDIIINSHDFRPIQYILSPLTLINIKVFPLIISIAAIDDIEMFFLRDNSSVIRFDGLYVYFLKIVFLIIISIYYIKALVGGIFVLFLADVVVVADADGLVSRGEGDGSSIEVDYIIISVIFVVVFLTQATFTMNFIC